MDGLDDAFAFVEADAFTDVERCLSAEAAGGNDGVALSEFVAIVHIPERQA